MKWQYESVAYGLVGAWCSLLCPVNNKQYKLLWQVFVTDSKDVAVLLDTMDKVENKPHLPGKNFCPSPKFLHISETHCCFNLKITHLWPDRSSTLHTYFTFLLYCSVGFALCPVSIGKWYVTSLFIHAQFLLLFPFFVQFLDKVEVEMRTCEEPRPPNGPSPIAITAGQR